MKRVHRFLSHGDTKAVADDSMSAGESSLASEGSGEYNAVCGVFFWTLSQSVIIVWICFLHSEHEFNPGLDQFPDWSFSSTIRQICKNFQSPNETSDESSNKEGNKYGHERKEDFTFK